MSILNDDFEEQVGTVVENLFVYCDLVVRHTFGSWANELTLMDIGKIIGPLEYVDNRFRFIRDYADIRREINKESILKELGIKQIISVYPYPEYPYRWIDGDPKLPEQVKLVLFVRLHSGATVQYAVIYKHIKETKR